MIGEARFVYHFYWLLNNIMMTCVIVCLTNQGTIYPVDEIRLMMSHASPFFVRISEREKHILHKMKVLNCFFSYNILVLQEIQHVLMICTKYHCVLIFLFLKVKEKPLF